MLRPRRSLIGAKMRFACFSPPLPTTASPSLAFAVGVYLPLSSSSPILIGGAIAGIGIAFLAGVMEKTDGALQHWAERNNAFYDGPNANLLSVLPFLVLTLLLFFVGREKLLGGERGGK